MATDELFRSLDADTKPVELERRLLSHISKRGSGGFDETFDRDGRGLVHVACAAGNPACVLLLLLHGCNPNLRTRPSERARDDSGVTPLHECCFAVPRVGTAVAGLMAELLLMHGGSLHIKATDHPTLARWDGRMSAAEILEASTAAELLIEDFAELVTYTSAHAPTEAVLCFAGYEPGAAVKTALVITDDIIERSGQCPRFVFCGSITPSLLALLDGIPEHAVVLQCQGTTIAERIAFCQAKLTGLDGRITVVVPEDSLSEVTAYFAAIGSERAAGILPNWLPHFGELAFVPQPLKTPYNHGTAAERAQTLEHGQGGKALDDLRRAFSDHTLGKYTPTKMARTFILNTLLRRASDEVGIDQPEQRPYPKSPEDLEAMALAAMDDSDTEDSDDEVFAAVLRRSPTKLYSPASPPPAGRPLDSPLDLPEEPATVHTVNTQTTSGRVTVTILTYNVAMKDNMVRLADPSDNPSNNSFLDDVVTVIRLTKANVIMLTGVGTYKVDGDYRVNFAEMVAAELGVEFRYSESEKLPDGTSTGVAFMSPFPILQKSVFRYKTAECVPATALSVMISVDMTSDGRRRDRARTGCTYVWCTVTNVGGRDGKVHEQQMRELDYHLKVTIKSDSASFLCGTFQFPKEERSAAYKYLTSTLRANLRDVLTFDGGVPTSTWADRATYPARHLDDDVAQPSKRWDYFFCNDHKILPKADLHQEVCDAKWLKHLATTSSHLPIVVHWR